MVLKPNKGTEALRLATLFGRMGKLIWVVCNGYQLAGSLCCLHIASLECNKLTKEAYMRHKNLILATILGLLAVSAISLITSTLIKPRREIETVAKNPQAQNKPSLSESEINEFMIKARENGFKDYEIDAEISRKKFSLGDIDKQTHETEMKKYCASFAKDKVSQVEGKATLEEGKTAINIAYRLCLVDEGVDPQDLL